MVQMSQISENYGVISSTNVGFSPVPSPVLRSSTSSATKWSRSILMPFLTTPTLSRDLPWVDGCPHILHASIMHTPEHTYITMQKAAYSHLMDFF